ncbi:MAG: DUF2291 domain-containing protein [Alphaproteobacteria bacterium]|nr:DUF2291 domain-containing protein [Alphaproteobacteria bacterium]MDE2494040.1 DUF2291 domain-containing protein [Alphaproteobacteria bacterium]
MADTSWLSTRRAILPLFALTILGGCKIVSTTDDTRRRNAHSKAFAAQRYVAEIWGSKARPYLEKRAVSLPILVQQIDENITRAGRAYGRQATQDGPWTFVAEGEGVVEDIQRQSREGRAIITVDIPRSPSISFAVQVGPVISGNAVRDALPFVTFDDFPDQIAFADVGHRLTEQALHDSVEQLSRLRIGEQVRFLGAFSIANAHEPIVMTPIALESTNAPSSGRPT